MLNKEPLVLCPGLLCDEAVWAPQIAAFSPERQVIVPNYGAADTLEAMAQATLDQAPDRFALAGHSMGARVALEVMRLAPGRVTRLALLDTGIHMPPPGEAEKRHALAEVGRREGMAALVEAWLPPMVHPDRHAEEALMAPMRAMAEAPGVDGFVRQINALLTRGDPVPLLPTIAVPTLVGVGRQDRWSPPEQHAPIADAIPGAMLVVFEDSGHMAPVEAPDQVNAALRDWLAR